MTEHDGRRVGRNTEKDQLRREVRQTLESAGTAVGSPCSATLDFQGSRDAALRLTGFPSGTALAL